MTYGIMKQGDDVRQPIGHDYYMAQMALAEMPMDASSENYFKKALTAGTAGSGQEFIPTQYSPKFIKFVYLNSWARQAFGTWTIQFGDTMKVPKFTTDFSPSNPDYVASEITDALGSATSIREGSLTTTSVTLTLKTIAINYQVQRKALDYNIVPKAQLEAYLREIVVKNLTEREEDVIVNGDTTTGSSNINNAYDATNHPHGYAATTNEWLIMFNGLRISATGTAVDAGSDAITVTDLMDAVKNLGKYGIDPKKVLFLISTDLRTKVIRFSQVETLETYGERATIFTGEIGNIYGSPLITTDKLPNTQSDTLTNSSGIRSSSTGTNLYTEAIVIYMDSPMIGVPADQNSALNVSIYDRPDLDRKHIIAREDFAFNLAYADAIVRIYNILP